MKELVPLALGQLTWDALTRERLEIRELDA
jgi:hypothetical protein